MLVPVHVFVAGLYLPPVFRAVWPLNPPKTIISLPVQTAVWLSRAVGTLIELVAVQESVEGVYLPPLSRSLPLDPPQTIISLPVQTAVWRYRQCIECLRESREECTPHLLTLLPPTCRVPLSAMQTQRDLYCFDPEN